MKLLLDTNIVSELRKGARANTHVRAWFDAVDEDALYLSVLTLGELRRGVERVRRRDPVGASALQHWLARVREQFSERIVPVDAAIAERWGMLGVPDPIPTIDGLLAATALVHGMTMVTRNTADFAPTGVQLLNPFVAF